MSDTKTPQSSPLTLEVTPASPEQKPILANLLELYAHDFSELLELKLDTEGRFGYKDLPAYWEEQNRYPFLIKVDGDWAGFVFVRKGSQITGEENVWDMAEFFVLRGYRRTGIGRRVALQIWNRFPGSWEVRVMEQNRSAKDFWGRAVHSFLGKAIEPVTVQKDGSAWFVFSFQSKGRN
jgi:predicted acetyltransferase